MQSSFNTTFFADSLNKYFLTILLVAASLCIYLPGINAPFVTTGEPREAVVAQSMILNNSLLHSVRYGSDVATKPPLLHWLMVIASQATGEVNEISARIPSVIAATTIVIVWTLFLIPLLGLFPALLFFLIISTTGEWFRHAAHARVDMLLASLISLALLFLFQWLKTHRRKYLLSASFFMSLAALTKGPIGVVLPVLIAMTALVYWKELTVRKIVSLSIAAFLAISPLLIWYIAQLNIGNTQLLDIVLHENIDRLQGQMSADIDPHAHGPLYLIGSFFISLMPWSFICIPAWLFFFKAKSRSSEQSEQSRRFLEWCIISTAVCFVIFLIPSSKRAVYLLPIFPAVTTLIAVLLDSFCMKCTKTAHRIVEMVMAFFCLLLMVVTFLRIISFKSFIHYLPEEISHKFSFYQQVLLIPLQSSSLTTLFVQLFPIFILCLLLWWFSSSRCAEMRLFSFHLLAVSLIVVLSFSKTALLSPLANALSPKNFIDMEIRDHSPTEISLLQSRMYAEAFYARQIAPDIPLTEYSDDSTFVLFPDREQALGENVLYIHRSEDSIKRPGKHLNFAILDSTS